MRRKKLEKLTNIIEAILFASGNAVPMDLLRDKLSLTKAEMDTAVRHLEKKYTGDCGIRLLTFNHKLQFATNPDYKDPVASVLNPIREKEFTRTILECAAIIAYKQPITRAELEAVRGINSDYAITTLQSLDMITPCGRKDVPGKPILYATTDNFLKRFKLKSLSDLPDYDELMEKIVQIPGSARTIRAAIMNLTIGKKAIFCVRFPLHCWIPMRKWTKRKKSEKRRILPKADLNFPTFSKI